MKKSFAIVATVAIAVMSFGVSASAQNQATGQTCLNQYEDLAGKSTASLLGAGYQVAAAVAGGVWLHKDKEAAYCNTGRLRDNETMCWRIREPVKERCQ